MYLHCEIEDSVPEQEKEYCSVFTDDEPLPTMGYFICKLMMLIDYFLTVIRGSISELTTKHSRGSITPRICTYWHPATLGQNLHSA